MTIITINYSELDAFKRSWPCHGLPDDLEWVSFMFDGRGDLVDLEAVTSVNGSLRMVVDTADFDGPALLALSEDARRRLGA